MPTFKIEITEIIGDYNKRRTFELQIPLTDAQFAEIVSSIVATSAKQQEA